MGKAPAYSSLDRSRKPAGNPLALPTDLFQSARRPHKKKPFVYKKEKKEKEEKLISIRSKLPKPAAHDFDKLDRLLQNDTKIDIPKKEFLSLPQDILQGKLDTTKVEEVQKKYKGRSFAAPRSKKTLKERTEAYLELVPHMLAGKEELSFYYTLALDQRKRSKNATMTLEERWDINWKRYVGGYYGLQRQLFILTLIQHRHKELLAKSSNKTVLHWTPDMFCTYVLANEIVLRLVMEDLKLSKPEAERILKDTADYGVHIADQEELEDDLEFGEFKTIG